MAENLNKTPLYDAVTCILSCVLQTDNNLQKQAIERLKQIEIIEEYPLVLCQIIGTDEEAVEERHIAAVFLKNYLENIFMKNLKNNAIFHKDFGKMIVLKLIQYMDTRYKTIREMITYNIALLLALGFWNSVANLLNNMILSEDLLQIDNGIFILNKAIDENFLKNNKQILIECNWFDILIDIFKMNNISSQTRLNCIHPMHVIIKHLTPNENYVKNYLTRLTEESEKILNEPYSLNSEFAFKYELIKFLNNCVDEYYEYCNIFILPLLPAIGNLLTICCEQYKKIIRGSDPAAPKDSNEKDEPKNFFDLVGSILEFIFNLIDMPYFDVLIEDLDNLIYCIYVFMACHNNNMEQNLFINSIQKNFHWVLRDTCKEILIYSLEKIEFRQRNGKAVYFKTMNNVFQKLNSEFETTSQEEILYMSRLTESMIYGTGLIKNNYNANDQNFAFPLDYYLNNWTNLLLTHCNNNNLLHGRILWLGGEFAKEISVSVMACHFKNIISILTSEDEFLIIPSVQALCNYLKNFKNMIPEKQYLISGHGKQFLECLISIAQKLNDFPLHHLLNAMGYLIKAQNKLAITNLEQLEELLVRIIINCCADPNVMKETNFICTKMAQIGCFKIQSSQDKLIQFLIQLLNHLEPRQILIRNDLDKVIDILNIICLYSTNIDQYLLMEIFTNAARRLSQNVERDVEIDESTGTLLITLIVKLTNQLKFCTIKDQNNVIGEFPQLLEMLLQPDIDLPSNILGKLVTITIFSLSELMEQYHESILRNVITSSAKMNVKKIRTTWIIFIFICMIRTSDTLNYLSILPGPNGGSALSFIIKLWQPQYFHIIDPIERKIIVLSVVHILQHCLDNKSEYGKMKLVSIQYQSEGVNILNGLEFLYYLLIECLLYENKLQKYLPQEKVPHDFEDFAENPNTRKEEDDIFLFHSHPFNINIIEHIVNFLKCGTEPYYNILKRFIPQVNYFRLRELGCDVPAAENPSMTEDME